MSRASGTGAAAALLLAALAPAAAPAQEGGGELAFHGVRPLSAVEEHLDGTPFKGPQGLFYDREQDEIFLADSGNGLVGIFSGSGVPKFTFAPARRGAYPVAVATDREGSIYVVSAGNQAVLVFNYRGEPRLEIDITEVRGVKGSPVGLAMDPGGPLYVLDGLGRRILAYTREGELLSVTRGSGRGGRRLQAPMKIARGPRGNLYVTDRRGISVQVYSPQGRYLNGWGKRGMGPDDFSAAGGIAVDSEGRVYVTDVLRQEVKVYSPEGKILGRFGGLGRQPGQVSYPTDVVVGDGRLFLVERVGRRIQIFQILGPGSEGDNAPSEHSPAPGR